MGSYSTPSFTDLDGDGDLDLIVGNGRGDIAYFENTGTVTAPNFTQRTGAANPFDTITKGSWSTVALADLDGDGDLDLAVGINDGDVHYYENTGTSANPDFISRTDETNPLNSINADSHSLPEFVDFDDDDDNDLVIGNRSGVIHYFENTGTTTDPSFTQRTDFDNPFLGVKAGRFTAPEFADLDGDGKFDLIIGNREGIIHYFENTGTHASPDFSPTSLADPTMLTLYDNGGNDTLDLRTDTNDQRVYLRPEGISDVYGLTGNLIIARDTVIENFIAGSGDDLVAGNAVANYLSGRDGDDRLWGSGGDDILEGGAGADTLNGGAGADHAYYTGSSVGVLVRLHNANAVKFGEAEGDTLTGIEHIVGSNHNDVLAGDGEDNLLDGGDGDDVLYGGPAGGDDMMYGGNGDDRVFGGRGNDILTGGAGNDYLKGGPGEDTLIADGDDMDVLFGGTEQDTFQFFPSDLGGGSIRDLTDGEDVIDLTEFTGINAMDDLDIISHGGNVRIEVSGSDYLTTIILSDFDINNLDNSDFLF